jgi:hypothetical protein
MSHKEWVLAMLKLGDEQRALDADHRVKQLELNERIKKLRSEEPHDRSNSDGA